MRMCLFAAVSATAIMASAPAHAQSGPPTDVAVVPPAENTVAVPSTADQPATEQPAVDDGSLKEIVVTANRRSQNLQDVGISIAAFTGDQLKALGVTTAADVAAITPNVEVVRSYASPGFNTQITIRGVGQPDFQDTTEAVATAYVDEFYMIGAGQADFLAFDISRVEVARGPQGTVQGRNSTAGSVNFYTNRPNTRDLSGELSVSLGERALVRTNGYFNLPISSQFAVRAAFATDATDGYLRNINPNSSWKKGGAGKFRAGRVQAIYKPNDQLSVLLKAEYGKMGPVAGGNEKGIQVGLIAGLVGTYRLPTDALGQNQENVGAGGRDVVNSEGPNELESKIQHYLATVNYDVSDKLSLVTLLGWLKNSKAEVEDCDHTPRPICLFSNASEGKHWMIESRAVYRTESWRLTFGANHLKQKIDVRAVTPLFFDAATSPFPTGLYAQAFRDKQDLSSWAIFGQAEVDITPKITLIGGARYTRDKKEVDSFNAASFGGIPFGTPIPQTLDQFLAIGDRVFANPSRVTVLNRETNGDLAVFDKGLISANAQVNYKPNDDLLIYASFRRGVKSGGFVTGNVDGTPAGIRKYGEETNNAFEVGAKSTLFGGKARLNGAIFYYDYKDLQNTSFIGITNVITNNDAKVYGAELELTARPVRGLDLAAGVGYVHSKVYGISNPTGAVAAIQNNELPLAPAFTGNFRVRYGWDAFGGELFTQASGRARSSMFRDSLNNKSVKIQSNATADAAIGYNSGDDRWSLTAWVTNVFNSRREINAFDLSGVFNTGEVVYQSPRWAGVTGTVRF